MNARPDATQLAAGLIDGDVTQIDLQNQTAEVHDATIRKLLESGPGRRWLRASSLLDADLANRLLAYGDDFSATRHDATLAKVIGVADPEQLVERAVDIASGSGATALWARLASLPEQFRAALDSVLSSDDDQALEATATHLLLDPAAPYGLTNAQQHEIAIAIIESGADSARGVAAEYLATSSPEILAERISQLAHDSSPSVRGFAWFAAFRANRPAAIDAAIELLGDESVGAELRRTALNAAGESLPTAQMIGLLSYFVVHPNHDLALDAANLLQRHHRHPEIAMAAVESPHDEVVEIATRLMDPYRGSPAAGGSRPGDPLRTDPLLQLMRQLEQEETEE